MVILKSISWYNVLYTRTHIIPVHVLFVIIREMGIEYMDYICIMAFNLALKNAVQLK